MKLNRIVAVLCATGWLAFGFGCAEQRSGEPIEPAGAERTTEPGATGTIDTEGTTQQSPDLQFLEEAARSGLEEVKLAELASQNAQSSGVKQFAERLERDHRQANQTIQRIANRKGLQIPTTLQGEHQQHVERLSKLSGPEFEKEFLNFVVQHHQQDIRKFREQGESGEDPAIRSFARETLSILQEHLNLAQILQKNPNASIPMAEPAGAQPEPQQEQDQQPELDPQRQQENQQNNSRTQPL